jgi:hypothetical protein
MNNQTHKIFRKLKGYEIKQHINNIISDGYSIIQNYVDVEYCEENKNLLDNIYGENKKKLGYFKSGSPVGFQNVIKDDYMINNLVAYDNNFLTLSTLGDHLEILKFFLNDPFYGLIPETDANFILAQLNARAGIVGIPFHVDTRMVTEGYTTWSMQCYLATEDIGSLNGGLIVISGSHKSGEFQKKEPTKKNDTISLDLKTGDIVLFSSQLHHATSKLSEGAKPVWTVLFTYRCWWCKQQFDLLSLVEKNTFTTLSDNQKFILGAGSVPPSKINASSSSRVGYLDMWSPS